MGSYSSYYCYIMKQPNTINFISTIIVGTKCYSNKKTGKIEFKNQNKNIPIL